LQYHWSTHHHHCRPIVLLHLLPLQPQFLRVSFNKYSLAWNLTWTSVNEESLSKDIPPYSCIWHMGSTWNRHVCLPRPHVTKNARCQWTLGSGDQLCTSNAGSSALHDINTILKPRS
jgi:hypothetical protein